MTSISLYNDNFILIKVDSIINFKYLSSKTFVIGFFAT